MAKTNEGAGDLPKNTAVWTQLYGEGLNVALAFSCSMPIPNRVFIGSWVVAAWFHASSIDGMPTCTCRAVCFCCLEKAAFLILFELMSFTVLYMGLFICASLAGEGSRLVVA